MRKFLIIKPTNQCNFDCSFCSSKNEEKQLLDIDYLVGIINSLSDKYSLDSVINGGEPFIVDKEYYRKLLDSKINSVSFQSNCELLYENFDYWKEIILHPKTSLGISFQLGNQRKNSKDEVFTKEKFFKYQEFFKEKLGHYIFFLYVMTSDNSNLDQIDEFAEIVRKLKVDCRISPTVKSGKGSNCYIPQYRSIKIYNYLLRKHKDVIRYISPIKELLLNKEKCPFSLNCRSSITDIEADGKLYFCGAMGDRKIFSLDEDCSMTYLKKECENCNALQICHSCYIRIKDLSEDEKDDIDLYCGQMSVFSDTIKEFRERNEK